MFESVFLQFSGKIVNSCSNTFFGILSQAYNSPGVADRAARKVFTVGCLKPGAHEYISLSQKYVSGTAARYMLFWLAQALQSLMEIHPGNVFYETLLLRE